MKLDTVGVELLKKNYVAIDFNNFSEKIKWMLKKPTHIGKWLLRDGTIFPSKYVPFIIWEK